MSRRSWTVAHSLKGNWVYLYELDRKARIWTVVASAFCSCNLPEWAWRAPCGRPRRDADGWLTNSLAGALFDLEQWLWRRASDAEDQCKVATIEVDQAVLLTLAPDWAFLFEGDES